MKLILLMLIIALSAACDTFGQTLGFTNAADACLNENIELTDNSSGLTSYLWDFCQDALQNPKSTPSDVFGVPGNIPLGIEIVSDNGNWYGFVCNREGGANEINRIYFGNSLDNEPEIRADFDAAVNSALHGASEMKLIQINGNWFGFVANYWSNNLVRVDFGNSLDNATPAIKNLGNAGGWSGLYGVDVIEHEGNYFVLAVGNISHSISILDYSNTIDTDAPIVSGSLTVNNTTSALINSPVKVSVQKHDQDVFALVSNLGGNIALVDFGEDLLDNTPGITSAATVSSASALRFVKDGENYFGFVQNDVGDLVRLDFGATITSSPFVVNLGNFGGVGNIYALAIVKEWPAWQGFFVGFASNLVYRLEFDDVCNGQVSLLSSTSIPSDLSYQSPGTKLIEVQAYDGSSNSYTATSTILVTNEHSPDFDFTHSGVCLGSGTSFTAEETTGQDIASWSWNFDDGYSGSGINIEHTFSATGSYDITVSALGANDCLTEIVKTITIIDPPQAQFELPSGSHCTNQSLTFTNTTEIPDGFDAEWQWQIAGENISSEADLQHVFVDPVTSEITLTVSIPGCSDEASENISVLAAPDVEFTYTHNCFGEFVQFINETTGENITSFSWDFDDGSEPSDQSEPQHLFASTGSYDVRLTVTNIGGCTTDSQITIEVSDQPVADFSVPSIVENLPFTIQGEDLTLDDDAIEEWRWILNETIEKNGEMFVHTFDTPGSYPIAVTVTTTQGCEFLVEDAIVVMPSVEPTIITDFNSTACINETLSLDNASVNSVSFLWDFCLQDLTEVKSVVPWNTVAGASVPEGIETILDNGSYYTFLTSRENNKLFRIRSNELLVANESDIVELEVTSLAAPMDIRFAKQNNVWYALVLNSSSGTISRFRFGNGIENLPDETINLGNFGSLESGVRGFDLQRSNTNWIGLIVNNLTNKIHTIDFGNDIANIGLPIVNSFTSSVVVNPISASLIEGEDGWRGFITSSGTNAIVKINFEAFPSIPPEENCTNIFTMASPFEFSIVKEGFNYYGYGIASTGNLYFLNFGNDLEIDSSIDHGTYDELANSSALDIIHTAPDWKGLVVNYESREISKISFSSTCENVSRQSATGKEPTDVRVLMEEDLAVEIFAVHENGNVVSATKLIDVTGNISVNVDFEINESQCLGKVNTFVATPGFVEYTWKFADEMTLVNEISNEASHTFANAGLKNIRLNVEQQNGCRNAFVKQLEIYTEPVSNFDLPEIPNGACTNQEYDLGNTTEYDTQSDPIWEWRLDGETFSSSKSVVVVFETLGDHEIQLSSTIPGCSSVIQKMFNFPNEGPRIDFDAIGQCENDVVTFLNKTSITLEHLEWNFGDNNYSTESEVDYVFSEPGVYEIQLQGFKGSCTNSKSKQVEIFRKPIPSFQILPPPVSCNATDVPFEDQSLPGDGSMVGWSWNFGDLGSEQNSSDEQSPSHIFQTPGDYQIRLQTVNDKGCVNEISQSVTIAPKPVAELDFTSACQSKPTTFLATGDNIKFYYWEMGTSYYEVANPTHVFTLPGQYDVKLVLTGENNCVTTYDEVVVVPEVVVPDFSFEKNCVGFETAFTDLTSGDDPVESYVWDFAGEGTSNNQGSTSFQFNSTGSKAVSLEVLTQSGCAYSKTKNINVVPAPVAIFTVSTESGAVPLEVEFTNNSTGANSFSWDFGNTETSLDPSPTHTYTSLGDFEVKLTASNPQGCENSFVRNIGVESPTPDVELKLLSISENPNGTLKVILTIQNNGNTVIRDLPVEINISGKVALTEIVKEAIRPAVMYNLVLDYGINADNGVQFLCAETTLENDLNTNDNRICKDVEQSLVILEPYPNPVNDKLNIEWIATDARTVSVMITDMFGKTVLQTEVDSKAGLNRSVYYTEKIQAGLYILTISDKNIQKTERIFISNQN